MKIIDNKKDYYDYFSKIYQDDYFTFDRRGSFYLIDYFEKVVKEKVRSPNSKYEHFGYFLLRIGYDNWIIGIKMDVKNQFSHFLVHSFKNFDKLYKFQLGLLRFDYIYNLFSFLDGNIEKKRERIKKEMENEVRTSNFNLKYALGFDLDSEGHHTPPLSFQFSRKIPEEESYALFDGSCVPKLIQPFDMYRAFEDYFSAIKTEKNVDNRTNEEHIVSHGFDSKESFRNIKE